jgi:glucosamine--fructose-6-phosphate aminotransferase (isomerizing)
LTALASLPDAVERLIADVENIQKTAYENARYEDFFFLGRGAELPIAMEGSLKLKEISYIHSEAYASGELKHGSIALIDEKFPTILLNARTSLYEKNISTVQEIKAR